MHIKSWLKNTCPEDREKLARACGISVAYLWQLAGKHKMPSCKLAIELEKASSSITPDRIISMKMMRPDLAEFLN